MPKWVSDNGVCHPGKEVVSLVNNSKNIITNPSEEGSIYFEQEVAPGMPFIYEGPDRASLYELWKIDKTGETTTTGQDFRHDVELRDRVKQMGYNSIHEYAKVRGYNPEKAKKDFEAKAARINLHSLPERIKMLEIAESGGDDTSGQGNSMKGGFGAEPTDSARF